MGGEGVRKCFAREARQSGDAGEAETGEGQEGGWEGEGPGAG